MHWNNDIYPKRRFWEQRLRQKMTTLGTYKTHIPEPAQKRIILSTQSMDTLTHSLDLDSRSLSGKRGMRRISSSCFIASLFPPIGTSKSHGYKLRKGSNEVAKLLTNSPHPQAPRNFKISKCTFPVKTIGRQQSSEPTNGKVIYIKWEHPRA